MIILKTGVPGSGKSLSMVYELLQKHRAECKGAEPRPVYTNITDLNLPHFPLKNWEPDTKREHGVLYTIDWRQCPAGSIIIIDECFLYGYDGRSAQAAVPDYIRDLAVHRKDYAVDIYFICQHPKLLHIAARRQVGKHQHYRRMFGMQRAQVYEWDQCQDNLSATKTAVMSHFSYPSDAFKAYKSAEVHNKPKFKLPWFVYIPFALLPLAAWAVPSAYHALSGAMTGKGIQGEKLAAATGAPPAVPESLPASKNAPAAPAPAPFVPDAPPAGFVSQDQQYKPPQISGCIVTPKGCACYDPQGKKLDLEAGFCEKHTGAGGPKPLQFDDSPLPRQFTPSETDAIRVAGFGRQQGAPKTPNRGAP